MGASLLATLLCCVSVRWRTNHQLRYYLGIQARGQRFIGADDMVQQGRVQLVPATDGRLQEGFGARCEVGHDGLQETHQRTEEIQALRTYRVHFGGAGGVFR